MNEVACTCSGNSLVHIEDTMEADLCLRFVPSSKFLVSLPRHTSTTRVCPILLIASTDLYGSLQALIVSAHGLAGPNADQHALRQGHRCRSDLCWDASIVWADLAARTRRYDMLHTLLVLFDLWDFGRMLCDAFMKICISAKMWSLPMM